MTKTTTEYAGYRTLLPRREQKDYPNRSRLLKELSDWKFWKKVGKRKEKSFDILIYLLCLLFFILFYSSFLTDKYYAALTRDLCGSVHDQRPLGSRSFELNGRVTKMLVSVKQAIPFTLLTFFALFLVYLPSLLLEDEQQSHTRNISWGPRLSKRQQRCPEQPSPVQYSSSLPES